MTYAEARFNKIHIRKVHVCLAVTCHLHFWQNDRDFLRATVVTRGGTDTEIRVSTESRPWRRKFSRRSSRDSNPRPFNHESSALTTELSPPPPRPLFMFFVIYPMCWVFHFQATVWVNSYPHFLYLCSCSLLCFR